MPPILFNYQLQYTANKIHVSGKELFQPALVCHALLALSDYRILLSNVTVSENLSKYLLKTIGGIKMTKTTFTKTNAEMIALIAEYQKSQDEDVFAEIYHELNDMAVGVATGFYKEKWLEFSYIPLEDYINCAQFGIFKAIGEYDVTIGSPVGSFFKQKMIWTMQDEVIKPACYKPAQFNTHASMYSLDKPASGLEVETYADIVAHEIASDKDVIYTEAFQDLEADPLEKMITLMGEYYQTAKKDDSDLIKVIFATAMNEDKATARVVNKALESAFPHVKSATLRKRKSRVLEAFTAFAMDKGVTGLDLSQF